jgi:TM2 domain-containing membrane protein YozV
VLENLLSQPKNQKVAVLLALAGAVTPLAGLHKFYLRQYGWGLLYLILFSTPIPHVASAIEAIWYLLQHQTDFDRRFNEGLEDCTGGEGVKLPEIDPARVGAIANALRELDQLRQEGLMSEYEFEQKRRQLLDRIA